jgi:hypothetical protein
MRPIIAVKKQEKISKKPNPTYDGFVEPDFPDELKNMETIEGIDSNHDGLRDDLEIWANRTAEDEYVRLQLKDFLKKFYAKHFVLSKKDSSRLDIQKRSDEVDDSGFCLIRMISPYKKSYLKQGIDRFDFYLNSSQELLFNTPSRKHLVDLVNRYNYDPHSDSNEGRHDYCAKGIPLNYVDKIMN